MKFIFTADIHLKWWQDRDHDENGVPMKLVETLNAFEDMCKYAVEHKIEKIIIGGDLNDTKSTVNTRSFVLFRKILEKYEKEYTQLTFIFIPGNHDLTAKFTYNNAVDLMVGPSNVLVYNDPTVIDDITLIPWNYNIADEIYKADRNRILISHFGLSDAKLSSGISIRANLSSDDLKKFDLVLLGHYHKPQTIGHVHYVGSPIPFKRDEAEEEKRFLVVDTATLEVESIPTKGYRQYRIVEITEESDVRELNELIRSYKENGDFIIVKKRVKTLPKSLEEFKDIQLLDLYEEDHQMRGITSSMNIEDQMKQYMKIKEVPDNERDKHLRIAVRAISDDSG